MANSDDDPGIPKPPSLPAPVGEADDVFAPPPAPLTGPTGPTPAPPVPPLGDLGDDLFSAPVVIPAVAPTVPKPVIIPLPAMPGPLVAPTALASPAKPDSEAGLIDPIQPKSEAAELGAKSDLPEQPEPKPPDATSPETKPEPTKLAPVDTSSLRAPAHDRKTSTQAHIAVGEFGVFPDEPDDEDVESPATPVVGSSAAPSGSGRMPMLVGLGLVATLVVAFVISNQTPSGEGPPKPNRGEPNQKDAKPTKSSAPEPEPRPRPPTDTTRLVDAEDGDETEGGDVAATSSSTSTTSTGDETETTGDGDVDPRDPSVVPPGTPDANVKAFLKLPVSVHDGPPLGGIGATGIHVDAVETGREYAKGQCQNTTGTFSLATDTTVSVCFRVVHGRQEESVRVLWDKDGRTSRRASVRIRDIHAYKTAAHLELRPEYVGAWRVRIVGDDDVELASVAFEIAP